MRNTRAPYELILVDDGSIDNSYLYFRTITSKAIRSRINRGVPFSRNLGLAVADGDLIVFIDNDVVVHPGWLSKLITESQNANVGIIGYIPTDESYKLQYPRSADGLIDVYEIAGACLGVTREAFDRTGFFDKNLRFVNDDTDYCFRTYLNGFRVTLIPELIQHNPHRTVSIDKKNESRPYFWEKWGDTWICKAAFPHLKWDGKKLISI